MGPRSVNLARLMDARMLADSAVDLNLKLMRWRMMPPLDVARLAGTKCLLFGAGTLGCYVARALIGWGVRDITFLDSGAVSHSNPVRQPLFRFADAAAGAPKAEAAAASLAQVFPGVRARGVRASIPMPGHPAEGQKESDAVRRATRDIAALAAEHDVLFLLTDTRESRWLPSLLGAALGKLTINAALGFDTWMAMRHGLPAQRPGERLGCYFCSDVVAPLDSMSNRPLDQQCTVTRPGLAAIAGASAVELMVNVLHHPEGKLAAGDAKRELSYRPGSAEAGGSPMGLVPHQVRGFLSHFSQILPVGKAFDRCIACSGAPVAAWEAQGAELVLKACNDPKHLERITGLEALQREAEAAMAAMELGDDDAWGSGSDDF